MKILNAVQSAVDDATKYTVQYNDGLVGEVSFLRYKTKDVVCVPTATACRMGCKFCHLSNEPRLAMRGLTAEEMVGLVMLATRQQVVRDPLLVSFMGAGEPLVNIDAMQRAMLMLGSSDVRFGYATLMPAGLLNTFTGFIAETKAWGIRTKVHLSLHFTRDDQRKTFMPQAADILPSVVLLEAYNRVTGNPVEVHYALIAGLNDKVDDILRLKALLKHRDIPVKVLHYSENHRLSCKPASAPEEFVKALQGEGVVAEFYKPGGLDIGASCGQFDTTLYVKR